MFRVIILMAVLITMAPHPNNSITLRPDPESNPCSTGVCTPYHQCNNGPFIQNNDGFIDLRHGEENGQDESHPCYGALQTCCETDEEGDQLASIPTVRIHDKCGIRNIAGIGYEVAFGEGTEAQFGEFPWTVAVLNNEYAGIDQVLNVYKCSGSLIHPSVVLTAAHCIAGKDQLNVRAGEWDSQSEDEIFPYQERKVASAVVHDQYFKRGFLYDVALLFLETPVNIVENVNTVCLPAQDQTFDMDRCIVSGWNKDTFGKEGKYQVILNAVELPIVSSDVCESALQKTRLGSKFKLNKSHICAGGETGSWKCKADGGAPLMCPIPGTKDQYVQSGIGSVTGGCNVDETPGLFANVALVRDWIDEKMIEHQLNT